MRSLAAAAAVPQMATDMILRAEEWEGKPESFIIPPQWENMDAEFGKELKKIITDSIMNRTISTMEEKSLRKRKQQLSGIAIYIMIFRHFKLVFDYNKLICNHIELSPSEVDQLDSFDIIIHAIDIFVEFVESMSFH